MERTFIFTVKSVEFMKSSEHCVVLYIPRSLSALRGKFARYGKKKCLGYDKSISVSEKCLVE
jgi:hypothetical protein